MTTKDLGPAVSGYLDPEGRNWETTVYQSGKPVLDKELNLTQDTEQDMELRLRRRSLPSGWISDDFLNTSLSNSAIFTVSATANELEIPQDRRAHVNGWLIRVGHTNANGTNLLDLGAGPAGAGSKRTDLVVLEVWRRLLAASPSTDGKSGSGRIWWFGNVKIAGADDLTLNFADDILDGAVGSETTKRVQIQYRLRVIQGVDIFANPYGVDDPAVVAHSVPASAAAPDGVATAFAFSNQSSAGDPGLWRAGDGNPANSIGSVDGYMYAIPLMAVIRRNTTAFDRNTNHNGGVASPGPSDRPDGLFHDIIADRDIVDLRLGISPSGWDYSEILEKNFNWLLDNVIRTELTATTIGGGVHGNTVLTADEIGITNAHGGDGTTTGDTPGAIFVGEFDAVRRRFSDRATLETLTLRYTPADGSGGGPNWANNDIITIDPTALPIYPYLAFNWSSFAPANFTFVGMTASFFIGNGASQVRAEIDGTVVLTGLGEVPQGSLTLDIGTVPTGVTDEDLILTMIMRYPSGVGLSKTPTADFGADSIFVNNPGQLPAGSPVSFADFENQEFDFPHRELFLTYETTTQVISFSGPAVGESDDIIYFPERVLSIANIDINAVPYAGTITLSDDGYSATLDPGSFSNGDEATVTFTAVRPLPQNDEQITVYYEARAPQTVRDANLPASITLIPRFIPSYLYSQVVGPASQDEAFPFPFQYVQMPGVYPGSGGTFAGDHEFVASGFIVLKDLVISGGQIRLPMFVGYVPNPQEAIFERLGGDVDAEGRSYFKEVPTGVYAPSALAQAFQGGKRHRNSLPFLAELAADSPVGKQGQLVLAVMSTYWEGPQAVNVIAFNPDDLSNNFASLSIYKVKGNLLNRRSS